MLWTTEGGAHCTELFRVLPLTIRLRLSSLLSEISQGVCGTPPKWKKSIPGSNPNIFSDNYNNPQNKSEKNANSLTEQSLNLTSPV